MPISEAVQVRAPQALARRRHCHVHYAFTLGGETPLSDAAGAENPLCRAFQAPRQFRVADHALRHVPAKSLQESQ